MNAITTLSPLSAIADRYDALICDLWGVVHDGVALYPGVAEALTRFRAKGGRVALLSNAPRPADAVLPGLKRLGLPDDAFDALVTSGDAARAVIASGEEGRAVYHLGPDRDVGLFDGLDVALVPLADADYTLCSGLFDDESETAADYAQTLAAMKARDMTLVCANPDRVVMRGPQTLPCAGAIADAYEVIGGRARWLGKPYPEVYELAFARIAAASGRPAEPGRTLAVGDGLLTDIPGARDVGIDAMLITGGIHWRDFGDTVDAPEPARVNAVCAERGLPIVAAAARLVW